MITEASGTQAYAIPMEAETIPTLITGFWIVILIAIGIFIFRLSKTKNRAYAWFIAQSLLLMIAFYYVVKVLRPQEDSAMVSENASLSIGLAAVFWAVSMVTMLCGIFELDRQVIKLEKK